MLAAWLHEMGYTYFDMYKLTYPEIWQLQRGVGLLADKRGSTRSRGRTQPRQSDMDKLRRFGMRRKGVAG